jgi:hypothetical protein
MLREIAPNLWVAEQPFRFLAMEVGIRTTIVRLQDGKLFVHSPTGLDATLRDELAERGEVGFVVAPNRFHHLFVADYQQAFPTAEFYCAPGLERKRPNLTFAAALNDAAPSGWAGELDQIVFTAFAPLNEVVFFHHASHTLILTDLLFNVPPGAGSIGSRLVLWLDGCNGHPAVPRTLRPMLKLRRKPVKTLLDRIFAWDFSRVVLSHGEVIETGAKDVLASAWSFIR